jgi:uncharacterized protein (DUF1800 family)
MSVSNILKNKHLLWRAGFGPSVKLATVLDKASPEQLLESLITGSSKTPEYIDVADEEVKGLFMGFQQVGELQQTRQLGETQRKEFRRKSTESIKSLNESWMLQMVQSEAQLREKVAFFWHGHFACRNLNIFYQQLLLDEIRKHALGSFRTLLKKVSQSAAMIFFLNNQQNKKGQPNENFAREVMELFTIGRGNYTETDIKEAARAFTGWTAQPNGNFLFRPQLHDDGEKSFLKKNGRFSGEDILDILLEQPQTALYLVKKIYRFYVNEEKLPDEQIGWLTKRFYENDYNISQLLIDIFSSSWFFDRENIGVKIKSPVELLVGMRRFPGIQFELPATSLMIQNLLGQILFYPPSVAGWPGGRNWIDSSSLLFRLQIPMAIAKNQSLNVSIRQDDDVQMGNQNRTPENKTTSGIRMAATINCKNLLANLEKEPEYRQVEIINELLLQCPMQQENREIVHTVALESGLPFQQGLMLAIMSTPEYQMC